MEGEIDGLLQMVTNLVRIEDRDGVLRNRLNDRDDVYFLHAKLTHAQWPTLFVEHAVRPFNLTGKKQRRRRIQPRSGDAGDGVGATRPGCHHTDTQMIGGFRVAFGADGAGLLVRIANRLDRGLRAERLIQVHGAAAGDQEDVLHTLIGDKTNNVVGKLHGSNRKWDSGSIIACWKSSLPAEDFLRGETTRGEQRVNQFAHCPVPSSGFGNKVRARQYHRCRIGGSGRQTGNCHGREIVNVVTHKADSLRST